MWSVKFKIYLMACKMSHIKNLHSRRIFIDKNRIKELDKNRVKDPEAAKRRCSEKWVF